MFAGGLAFCLVVSQDAIKDNLSAASRLREEVAANNKTEMTLIASQQHSDSLAEIARDRYAKGCLRVRGYLQSGSPVWRNGKPLPAGVLVCDKYGSTGKLIPADFDGNGKFNAVVGEIAYMGEPPVETDEQQPSTTSIRYSR